MVPRVPRHFWQGGSSGVGVTASEFEVHDADAPELLSWAAQETAGSGRTYSVVVVSERGGGQGTTRICGWDPSIGLVGETRLPVNGRNAATARRVERDRGSGCPSRLSVIVDDHV